MLDDSSESIHSISLHQVAARVNTACNNFNATTREGFAIENLLAVIPPRTMASFYRTSAGAEIDLVLEMPGKHGLWAIEIKRGLSPSPGKGFIIARADLKPKRSFIVYSGDQRYPIGKDVEAIGLREMARILENA